MRYLYLSIVLLVALAGCGGGGGNPDPLNINGSAQLTLADDVNEDNSLFEAQSFKATRDGWMQVTMASNDFDAYVLVYLGSDEDYEVGIDDDSGTDTNSVFFFRAEKDITYTAKFTSYGPGAKLGYFTYTIKEVTGPTTTNEARMLNSTKPVQNPAMKRAK